MSTPAGFASSLGPIITRYLTLKQALGRCYATERAVLAHLDRFIASNIPECSELTAESFAGWCSTFGDLKPGVRRARMRIVRNACLYRQRSEPDCFVPDPSGFPRPHARPRPYFFTEQDIARLLCATDRLEPSPKSPLHREVFRLAVVLLYTAGLRRGELVRLNLADYDLAERTLRIRATKFHKSRLVPLSFDAAREMEAYFRARRSLPHAADTPLLCSRSRGLRPYSGGGLAQGLRRLFDQASVRTETGHLPRVHDMRHSFALHALRRWYEMGLDVQAKLPALATYMGHVSIVSTQTYLSFLEPLAEAASERFARHCEHLLALSAAE
jgi:integrase